MKKKVLLSLLLLPLFVGCSNSEESDNKQREHTHTFSEEWSSNETSHWHASTCGHTSVKGDEGEHTFENGFCTVCSYEDPSYIPDPESGSWTLAQKQLFVNHLYGFEVPNLKGFTATWDETNQCIYITGVESSVEFFTRYVNSFVELGFSKENGPYQDSYILVKDVTYEGKTKTIELDTYISGGMINIICYDPFFYEWPSNIVTDLYENYFYIAPDLKIPSIDADKYFADTYYMESDCILSIYCYSKTNLEETYKEALTQCGFTVSESKNEDNVYVATEPQEISQVLFSYSSSEQALIIIVAPSETGWPSFVVDYYTDQLTGGSGTRVPAVTGALDYKFYENSYDQHGYFFVGCECNTNLEESYKTKLQDANYTVYSEAKNAAGNYWAISENNDLLVQYTYWYNDIFLPVYEEFDVLYEKYYPYNEEHVAAGLQIIKEGTKTTLPEYPGYGAKVTFSDNDVNMFINIQSASYSSVTNYANTLNGLGWTLTEYNQYNYLCISPARDIKLTIELIEGRPVLTVTGYDDPYKDWPSEGVEQILKTLDLTGDVPVFEGAVSYDYENDDYHDVVCFVPIGNEQTLIEAYYEKLVGLGWRELKDGDFTYYIKDGYTIGLLAYVEEGEPGRVYVDISFADGKVFDLDARNAFIDWKVAYRIKSKVQIPGIDFTNEISEVVLTGDEGETYDGFELFELIVGFRSGNISSSLDEVISQFVDAGWVYSSTDKYYHKDDVWMTTYEDNGKLFIDICAELPPSGLLSIIDQFIDNCGYTGLVELPKIINIADDCEFVINSYETGDIPPAYNLGLSLTLKFSNTQDAADAAQSITLAFKNKGWVQKQTDPVIELLSSDDWMTLLKLHITYVEDSTEILFEFIDGFSM